MRESADERGKVRMMRTGAGRHGRCGWVREDADDADDVDDADDTGDADVTERVKECSLAK